MAKKNADKAKKPKRSTTTSLAVKYRPRTLDDLVGQDAVATQVRGMVKSGRFPSTIGLFGESGSGKTTISRMIARYVNCLSPSKDDGSPCNECASCTYGDAHPDLHELNMADNRGIDDIRNLIQSAKSMPTLGNRRVFILDEVHACFTADTKIMLSNGSFITMAELGERVAAKQKVRVASYNHVKGEVEAKKVTHFLPKTKYATELRRVGVRQMGTVGYIDCTYDHKIWSTKSDAWVKAEDLQGHTLLSNINVLSTVVSIDSSEDVSENDKVDVYDLTVADNHNYFVLPSGGVCPVLVSNCTPQAFQTLLKPLEDAPPHTMWLLATTNPEKLPSTILGRCHKFQIKPIPEEAIVKRLRVIAKKEGVDFKEVEGGKEILSTIANVSNGRMRDSISSLESVLFALASGKEFTPKQLIAEFATTAEANLDKAAAEFLYYVLKGDAKGVISTVLATKNVRGIINKTRWLAHGLVCQSVNQPFFKTYAWNCFNALLRKDNGVKVRLSLLLEIQHLLVTVETQLNSVSIDETVLFTSAVGNFLVQHKQ